MNHILGLKSTLQSSHQLALLEAGHGGGCFPVIFKIQDPPSSQGQDVHSSLTPASSFLHLSAYIYKKKHVNDREGSA